MKVSPCTSFKGTFYTVADSHTRLPMTAGLLTEIEKEAKMKQNLFFYWTAEILWVTIIRLKQCRICI